MKLTSLLAQYLYTNNRLDLPGIGTFLLDPDVISSQENSKQRSAIIDGISFESNPATKENPELIAYISSQTGKMKALASADLESHIQLIQQFLNIGKPFTVEGIGNLVKNKTGKIEFAPLNSGYEKLKEFKPKETAASSSDESPAQYESFLSSPKNNISWTKPVIGLLIVAGIGLAIWGGYTISRKAATEDSTSIPEPLQEVVKDSTPPVQAEPPRAKDYKYVLQVSKKQTALRRYNQLRTNLWDVKMETQDSVLFKLYMLLPVENADTTRILDSLTAMTGKKVYIEPQN